MEFVIAPVCAPLKLIGKAYFCSGLARLGLKNVLFKFSCAGTCTVSCMRTAKSSHEPLESRRGFGMQLVRLRTLVFALGSLCLPANFT